MTQAPKRRPVRAATSWMSALIVMWVLLWPQPAFALPPQVIMVSGWALSWLALAVVSTTILFTHVLPRWLRRLALLLVTLTAMTGIGWGVLMFGASTEAEHRPIPGDRSSLQEPVPELLQAERVAHQVLSAEQAVEAERDGHRVMWVDLRGDQAFRRAHVTGAVSVPLLGAVRGVFRLDELDWTLRSDDDPRGLKGRLPVSETLARIESLYQSDSPTPDKLLLYCNGGFTSAYIANALQRRGVPAKRIPGGINALRAAGASVSLSSPVFRKVEEHELAAIEETCDAIVHHEISRENNLSWSRRGSTPPPTLTGVDEATCWLLKPSRRGDSATARWAGSILESWGVQRIYILKATGELEVHQYGGLIGALSMIGPGWWYWTAALALLIGLFAALQRLKSSLRGRKGPLMYLFIIGHSLLAWGVEVAAQRTAGTWLEDTGGGVVVVLLLTLILALLVGFETFLGASRGYWRRMARRRALPSAGPVQLISFKPFTPIPLGRPLFLRLSRSVTVALAVVGLSSLALRVLSIPTLIVGLIAFTVPPLIEWALWEILLARLQRKSTPEDRAATVLRWGGLRPPAMGSWTVATRAALDGGCLQARSAEDGLPIQWPWFEPPPRAIGRQGARGANWARTAAMMLGQDIKVTSSGWQIIENSGSAPALLFQLSNMGLELGCDPARLGELLISERRFEEALSGASTLAAELLALQVDERGGAGFAARRFGGRLPPTGLVRIGTRLWEVTLPSEAQRRPRLIERIVARSFISLAHEHLEHDIATPYRVLREQQRGLGRAALANALIRLAAYDSAWPAILARAAAVADRETRYLANQAQQPAYPPNPNPLVEEMTSGGIAPTALGYGLRTTGSRAENLAIEDSEPLPSHIELAYGDGPKTLKLWRGRARRAARARDRARGHYITSLHALGDALGELVERSGETYSPFDCSLETVLDWLRKQSPLPVSEPSDDGLNLPSEFTLATLFAQRVSPGSGLSGKILCGHFPVDGEVVWVNDAQLPHLQGGQIAVMQRLKPDWIGSLPKVNGIIVASSSSLSHGAILARERGLPTLIGVGSTLNELRDGDRIRIDPSGCIQPSSAHPERGDD